MIEKTHLRLARHLARRLAAALSPRAGTPPVFRTAGRVFAAALLLGNVSAFAQGMAAIDAVAAAHGAGPIAPASVEMTGTVERSGKTERFRILATRDEELRVDYGTAAKDALVQSSKWSLRDDGQKAAFSKNPPGFSQLDVTGVFLLEQLRGRAVRVEPAERTERNGIQRIRVRGERTEKHGSSIVEDRVDLYVDNAGLLAAVARTYYEKRPERLTRSFSFSDYRKVDDRLLPHRIEVALNGKTQQVFRVETYRFDVSPDRENFVPRRKAR